MQKENIMNKNSLTPERIVLLAKKKRGITLEQMAEITGTTAMSLSRKLKLGVLKADELFIIMKAMGFELRFIDKETGLDAEDLDGEGRPVRGTINRIIFDTEKSIAVANDFFSDGVHKYNSGRARELYIDKRGRYFFAEYSDTDGEKDRIRLASPLEAREFIQLHGKANHNVLQK